MPRIALCCFSPRDGEGHAHSKDMKKSAKIAPAVSAGKSSKSVAPAPAAAAVESAGAPASAVPTPRPPKTVPPALRDEAASSASSSASEKKGQGSPLNKKTYLSKSQDNLASSLRRKAATAASAHRQRPVSWVGEPITQQRQQLSSAVSAEQFVPQPLVDPGFSATSASMSQPVAQKNAKTVNFACDNDGTPWDPPTVAAGEAEPASGPSSCAGGGTGIAVTGEAASAAAATTTPSKPPQAKSIDGIPSLLRPTASSLQKSVPAAASKQQQLRELSSSTAGSAPRPSSGIPRLAAAVQQPATAGLSSASTVVSSSLPTVSTSAAAATTPMPTSSMSSLSAASLTTTVIKKSSSIQNLTRHSQSVLRRVSSTHNVSGSRSDGGRRTRAVTTLASSGGQSSTAAGVGGQAGSGGSAPSSAVAYNVELLASFEKEKRVLEGRISGLVQITENRKAEIEKHKIEIRNLRKRLPSREVLEELEKALNENRLLRDRLAELGVSVEQITDSEKLSMLSSAARAQRSARAGSVDNLFEVDDLDVAGSRLPTGSLVAAASSRKSDSSGNLLDENDYNNFDHGTPDRPSILSAMDSAWEKQSNKSSDGNSEVSVACLQDRILQMEETHYSTNEELQATLQELGDLQQSVNQLSEENEHLTAEKSVLLQSLCAQTEKLENARTQIEHLKALVLSDMSAMISSASMLGGGGCDSLATASASSAPTPRESQLAGLLRSAQEEREELLLRQQQLNTALAAAERNAREARASLAHALADNSRLVEEQRNLLAAAERQRLLEEQLAVKAAAEERQAPTVTAAGGICGEGGVSHSDGESAAPVPPAVAADRSSCGCKVSAGISSSKTGEAVNSQQQLIPDNDVSSCGGSDGVECGSSTSAAAVITECTLHAGLSEAAAVAAAARAAEKEKLEQHVTSLQEALSRSQQDAALLREQRAMLEEELKLLRDDDKACVISELEFKCERANAECATLRSTCEQLRADLDESRKDIARHLEEARTNRLAVSDLQAELKGAKHRYVEFEKEMKALSQRHEEEAGEWRQFQADLQMAVVIANAIKTEAEEGLSRAIEENKKLKLQMEDAQKQIQQLQQELDRVKWQKAGAGPCTAATGSLLAAGSSGGSNPSLGGSTSSVAAGGDTKSRTYTAVESSAAVVSAAVPAAARRLSELKASQNSSVKSLIKNLEASQSILGLAITADDSGPLLRRMSSVESSGSNSPVSSVSMLPGSPAALSAAITIGMGTTAKSAAAAGSQPSIGQTAASPILELQQPSRPSPERRTSAASGEVQLKSALKKPAAGEGLEKKPRQSSFSYEKSGSPVIEPDGKLPLLPRVSESEKSVDGKKDGSAKDPLSNLVKQTGGSKRNALLKWCQQRTVGYRNVDVTNFSSSWNDGLAFCALLHGYMPDKIPYDDLVNSHDKKRNFTVAFQAAESVGIYSSLNVSDMVCMERPDWQSVMLYVTDIFKHFEFDGTPVVS